MTREQCYKDLIEIFSSPGDYSQKLEEGESYIFLDDGKSQFSVSKRWGYWLIVVNRLNQYFQENGNLDDGAVIPSNNDIAGTRVSILSNEEFFERLKSHKLHGNGDPN